MDFVIHGGPRTNPLWIPRDNRTYYTLGAGDTEKDKNEKSPKDFAVISALKKVHKCCGRKVRQTLPTQEAGEECHQEVQVKVSGKELIAQMEGVVGNKCPRTGHIGCKDPPWERTYIQGTERSVSLKPEDPFLGRGH